MKLNEISQLNKFLDVLNEKMSQSGCNYWEMPNNPENLELLKAAHRWNVKQNETEWLVEYNSFIKQYEENDLLGVPIYSMIGTSDFLIFGYLRHQLKQSIILET